jgi:uncharacterized membrane protein YsdA (DUF1294 family)
MLVPWLVAPGITVRLYLLLLVVISPISFALYGLDKRRAVRCRRRISEGTLHIVAFVGGWPGAWLGRRFFGHRTEKLGFRLTFWGIVALHLGFLLLALTGAIR